MSSLYMGCVSYSRQFFSDGVVDAHQMKQAELAARREIEVIAKQYRKMGWKEAYGSSGTAKALFAILTECRFSDRGITRAGLNKLKDRIIRSGRVIPSELPGIKIERSDVLPGGLAIMSACSTSWASTSCTPATARCAWACCTTCWAATTSMTSAMNRCASS